MNESSKTSLFELLSVKVIFFCKTRDKDIDGKVSSAFYFFKYQVILALI